MGMIAELLLPYVPRRMFYVVCCNLADLQPPYALFACLLANPEAGYRCCTHTSCELVYYPLKV